MELDLWILGNRKFLVFCMARAQCVFIRQQLQRLSSVNDDWAKKTLFCLYLNTCKACRANVYKIEESYYIRTHTLCLLESWRVKQKINEEMKRKLNEHFT